MSDELSCMLSFRKIGVRDASKNTRAKSKILRQPGPSPIEQSNAGSPPPISIFLLLRRPLDFDTLTSQLGW